MRARMRRITFSPDKADDVTRHVEESIVPSALQQTADNQRGTARDPLWLERTSLGGFLADSRHFAAHARGRRRAPGALFWIMSPLL